MSKEKPNEDPRQPINPGGPVEREQRNEDRIDLEKWHDTNTH
jgi:hypothetical protein